MNHYDTACDHLDVVNNAAGNANPADVAMLLQYAQVNALLAIADALRALAPMGEQ
jgi:hypothetical protein